MSDFHLANKCSALPVQYRTLELMFPFNTWAIVDGTDVLAADSALDCPFSGQRELELVSTIIEVGDNSDIDSFRISVDCHK